MQFCNVIVIKTNLSKSVFHFVHSRFRNINFHPAGIPAEGPITNLLSPPLGFCLPCNIMLYPGVVVHQVMYITPQDITTLNCHYNL